MRRFFDRADTKWRRLDGAIHLYALPEPHEKVTEKAKMEDRALADIAGLAVQPVDYLHMTLQRFDLYRDEISDEQWKQLDEELTSRIGALSAFDVAFNKPQVRQAAIEVVGKDGVEWQKLVDAIRDAFSASGLGDSLTDQPFGPHYTLAYCSSDTDAHTDAKVQKILDEVSVETTMHVSRAWMVAVNQSPQEGVFRFRKMKEWHLGVK
ncbi:2'-5' RNA ligase family protein [Bifidobacterium sp. ESL0690]|uniref:2'-5' RNA ligase family protein n=1 Tax=Bifidobacterium sp. ESL0690 TaxID=2983214 RepID=UPI0023F695AC|nr:2'-5' RNA ligase family protein [Bifidobacterium sp. ESL0690]WEV46994.1 2'-5' RNA ligase family protein [Bifidobacterium sp. ESL0690]